MIKETRVNDGHYTHITAEGSNSEVGKWFLTMTPKGGKWLGASYLRRDEDAKATVTFLKVEEKDVVSDKASD